MSSEVVEPSSTKDNIQAPVAASQPTVVSSKPSVSIQGGSHLDPGAYVRGTYPITIGQNVLVHPRAHLLSVHGPLTIGDGCVIGEKCILGGPLPATTQQEKPSEGTGSTDMTQPDIVTNPRATILEDLVHLHPNVTVHCGTLIKKGAVVESNTSIASDISIGSHSKICSILTISDTVPDWTVVWGSTMDLRRRDRTTQFDEPGKKDYELVESERLRAMQRERDGAIAVLRAAASKSLGSSSRVKK